MKEGGPRYAAMGNKLKKWMTGMNWMLLTLI
jgi:hypothetical protein